MHGLADEGIDPTDEAIWPEPIEPDTEDHTADMETERARIAFEATRLKSEPEIVIIYELDDGPPLYYQCDDHVDQAAFVAVLESQWGKTCDPEDVEHIYILSVPRPEYGPSYREQLIYHTRGRGRKAVTQVDMALCQNVIDPDAPAK